MNKGVVLSIILVLIVVLGGFYFYGKSHSDMNNMAMQPGEQMANTESNIVVTSPPIASTTPAVDEFTVSGKNYLFSPNTLMVKKGDTVKIKFVNTQGMHNIKIDEFNASSKTIKGGEQDVMEFVADKTGSFQYYCSVGQHRANGMWGTLTVTE